MGRSKSKRSTSAGRVPADLSALPLPAWAAADAVPASDADADAQPSAAVVLDTVARRVRALHGALTSATLPAAQLAVLRDFKSTLHEWLPRKRRDTPADGGSQGSTAHRSGADAAGTLAEARAYDYLLQLYAWPAPRVPLLRATVRGLLEALAPAAVRDAACAALRAAIQRQDARAHAAPAEGKEKATGLGITGAARDAPKAEIQRCSDRGTAGIGNRVVDAALRTALALGQAAAAQLEAESAAAAMEAEAAGVEASVGRARAQAQARAQSPLIGEIRGRSELLLSAANALIEYAPTQLALVVVCDAAAPAPPQLLQPAAGSMQPLETLLALASSLICRRMTDVRNETDNAQRAVVAVQACQRALPSIIALLRLHVRTQRASQSRSPPLAPPSPLAPARSDDAITASANVLSSSASAAAIGTACLSALALAGAGKRQRLASLLQVVRGFRSQAAACALLALQAAETDSSALAARLSSVLEERLAPMASRLAMARALAGTASDELLLIPLPALKSRPDGSGNGTGGGCERAGKGCLLGGSIPDLALEAAAAATPSERTWALDCLRAWLLRVTDLCRSEGAHQPVAGRVTDAATSGGVRAAAQPRVASVAAAALRCWGHADVKLGKMAALVLGAAAVAEQACGSASGAAQGLHSSGSSVLALVLSQPASSAHKYTALISMVPHLSGLASLLQGAPRATVADQHEATEERKGNDVGEPRDRPETELLGDGAAAMLAAMRASWADPKVACHAAAVVVAVLQRAVRAMEEEQEARQRQRLPAVAPAMPTPAHVPVTRQALVSHCRVHWLPQLAAAMLGHRATRGAVSDNVFKAGPRVDRARARAAHTALPLLLNFDGRAGPALAAELRRQADTAGALLQPSALRRADGAARGAALLRALIALAEAHGRGGVEGAVIEWREIEAAAAHADPELRATAMRAVLHGAGAGAAADDGGSSTTSTGAAGLARLPPARALQLVCRSFCAELMLVPSSQLPPPMALPIPLPPSAQSKESGAQSTRACVRLLIGQLARAEHGARQLRRRQTAKPSATMSVGDADALRRAGDARADITRIALAAVFAPAHWVLSSTAGVPETDAAAGNEAEDAQDGRDIESSVVLVTALDVLLGLVQQWRPNQKPRAVDDCSSDCSTDSSAQCDDLLVPPIGPMLLGTQHGRNAADPQASSTMPALTRRLLVLLSHPRSSVRLHAESLLVALTPSQALCRASATPLLPSNAAQFVLRRCLGAHGADSTSIGLVAAPRRTEAEAAATAVALLHRFGDGNTAAAADATATASKASTCPTPFVFFGDTDGDGLRLLAFFVGRLEDGLEARRVPSYTSPPLLHGLLLCVGRVIERDINWASIVAQQKPKDVSTASVLAGAMWSVRKLVLRCLVAVGAAVSLSLRVVAEAGTEGGRQSDSASDSGSSSESESESEDDAGPNDGATVPAASYHDHNAATGSGSNLTVGGRCSETVLEARARDGGGEAGTGDGSAVAARVAGAWMCVSEGTAALAALVKGLLPLLSLEPSLDLVPVSASAHQLDGTKGQLMFGRLVGGIVTQSAWQQAEVGTGVAPMDLMDAHEAACVLRLLLRALLRLKHVGALGATANALQTGLEAVLLLAMRYSGVQRGQADADASATTHKQWQQELQSLVSLPRAMLASLCHEAMGVHPTSTVAPAGEAGQSGGERCHRRHRSPQRRYLLRRSAGFAAAFLAIARAEPATAPPALLTHATAALLVAAAGDSNRDDCAGGTGNVTPNLIHGSGGDSPHCGTDDDNDDNNASWRRRVHAMNVLRLLCRDGRLGASLQSLRVVCPVVQGFIGSNQSFSEISSECDQPQEQALACALVIAVRGFLDSHWAVRNSSLMLFAAAVQRSLGGNRMTDRHAGSGVHSAGAGAGLGTGGGGGRGDGGDRDDPGDVGSSASGKIAAAGSEPGASAFPTADAFFKSFPLLRYALLEHLETTVTVVAGVRIEDAALVAARATAAAALHPPLVLLARLWRPDDGDESISLLVAGLQEAGCVDTVAVEQANWLRCCASVRCLASLHDDTVAARRRWPLWQRLVALSLRAAASVDAMVRAAAARALPAALPPAALPTLLQSLGAAIVESSARFRRPLCPTAPVSAPPAGVSPTNLLHGRLLQLSAALRAMRVSHGGSTATLLSLRGVLAGAAAVCGTGFGAGAGCGAALGVGGGAGAGADGVCADSASDSDSDTGDGAASGAEVDAAVRTGTARRSVPPSVPRSVLCSLTALIRADHGHKSVQLVPPPIADAALQCLVELTDLTAAGAVGGWLCCDAEVCTDLDNADEELSGTCTDSSLWSDALAAVCGRAALARLGSDAPAPARGTAMLARVPHTSSVGERAVAAVTAIALTLDPTRGHHAHEELLCLLRDTAPAHVEAVQSERGRELRLLRRAALAAAVHALRERHLLPVAPAEREAARTRLCKLCTELLAGLPCWASRLARPCASDAGSAATTDYMHAWQRLAAEHASTLALELRLLLLLLQIRPSLSESESESAGASLLAIAAHCAGRSSGTPAALRSAGRRALQLLGSGLGSQQSLCSRAALLPLIHRVWAGEGEREREVAAAVLGTCNLLSASCGDAEAASGGWCLALEMLTDPTSPARAVAAAARAVCCAASAQARRAVGSDHADSSTAAMAAQVAAAQLSHLAVSGNHAVHSRYARWVLCAATDALGLGLAGTRGTLAGSDAGAVAAAATARAAIAFACRRRPVFEPGAAVSAATAAAAAVAAAPTADALAAGTAMAPLRSAGGVQETLSPLPPAAPAAACAVARLCLPLLAPSLATATAPIREQAAGACEGAMSLLATLVPWATGAAPEAASSLPSLRPWADAPGAVVPTCVSHHPPVFASMALAAAIVQALVPQMLDLAQEQVSHFAAEIETALHRDGAGGGSSHGTEDEAGNAGGANNGLHPLLLPALRECVKAAAGAGAATLHDV